MKLDQLKQEIVDAEIFRMKSIYDRIARQAKVFALQVNFDHTTKLDNIDGYKINDRQIEILKSHGYTVTREGEQVIVSGWIE